MKTLLIYIAGVITGIILTFMASLLITKFTNNGITMFDKPRNCIETHSFEVFQVIRPGIALAHTENYGPIVLLVNDEGKYYYDDEIVEVPHGKQARQVGIYQYTTHSGYKTVPVVRIE